MPTLSEGKSKPFGGLKSQGGMVCLHFPLLLVVAAGVKCIQAFSHGAATGFSYLTYARHNRETPFCYITVTTITTISTHAPHCLYPQE